MIKLIFDLICYFDNMCFSGSVNEVLGKLRKKGIAQVGLDAIQPSAFVSGFSHPLLPITVAESSDTVTVAQWGLIPEWVKDAKTGFAISNKTLNARAETLTERKMYAPYVAQRCLIYLDGFYEWQHLYGKTYPHYIYSKSSEYICIGGLYTHSNLVANAALSCTMITTPANELMAKIHNTKLRMPLIIREEDREMWLNGELPDAYSLMKPAHNDYLDAHTIKPIRPQSVNPNDPDLKKPFTYPELAVSQGSLF
ncbi:MAG: SOS response-associated peptidase [Bacteroidota bacterium]|nr:SOS response-associated peptidase [Bacteroidota bacterium]